LLIVLFYFSTDSNLNSKKQRIPYEKKSSNLAEIEMIDDDSIINSSRISVSLEDSNLLNSQILNNTSLEDSNFKIGRIKNAEYEDSKSKLGKNGFMDSNPEVNQININKFEDSSLEVSQISMKGFEDSNSENCVINANDSNPKIRQIENAFEDNLIEMKTNDDNQHFVEESNIKQFGQPSNANEVRLEETIDCTENPKPNQTCLLCGLFFQQNSDLILHLYNTHV
jgi:hypothetical protein